MTPTLAIQMLGLGCPQAYQLRHENPGIPSSVGNAFGTAYHYGRQLCEERTFSEFGFLKTRWGLNSLLGKFTGPDFFRHGVNFRKDWEEAAVKHYLDQVFRFLWFHHKLVSVKAYGEALSRRGTKLVWWDAEMRLPVLDLGWLTEGTNLTVAKSEKWALKGAIDLIILTERNGRYFVRIIDHKVDGIDVHGELDGRDCRLQLNLYACWAMQAFRGLGITPDDVSLWVHKLTLNPMGLQVSNLPFNQQVYLETLGDLGQAIETYRGFQRSGFPPHPAEYLCQGCDFAFSSLCHVSMARPDKWGLRLPYVALNQEAIWTPREKKRKTEDLGKCPFCGAPMKKGKRLPAVCSNPMSSDCAREDM